MAAVAVADSTRLNKAKHTVVKQNKAQPSNGGEELPMGLAVEVQDMLLLCIHIMPCTIAIIIQYIMSKIVFQICSIAIK